MHTGKQPSFLRFLYAAQNQQTGKEKAGEHKDFSYYMLHRSVSNNCDFLHCGNWTDVCFHISPTTRTAKEELARRQDMALSLPSSSTLWLPGWIRQQKTFWEGALKRESTSKTQSLPPVQPETAQNCTNSESVNAKMHSPARKTNSTPFWSTAWKSGFYCAINKPTEVTDHSSKNRKFPSYGTGEKNAFTTENLILRVYFRRTNARQV